MCCFGGSDGGGRYARICARARVCMLRERETERQAEKERDRYDRD